MTILIKKAEGKPACEETHYLYEEGKRVPFGYVQRVGRQWWASIPGGDVHGYHSNRLAAIASLV